MGDEDEAPDEVVSDEAAITQTLAADPLLEAAWGVCSLHIRQALFPEDVEWLAMNLNEGQSIWACIHMPTGPLYGWSKYRKRPKEVWKFFRMRAVLTKLCHTPEMAAYRQALLQGRVVALKDWTQARVTDAQQATDEIMQDTDNVKPETRLRAAESILSRQERYEQVQRDEGRPKITIDIQAAAAFADVVEDAEVRVIDVPDTEDTAKGRALVDNQSSTGEAEGS
jgi:hypothetical protein